MLLGTPIGQVSFNSTLVSLQPYVWTNSSFLGKLEKRSLFGISQYFVYENKITQGKCLTLQTVNYGTHIRLSSISDECYINKRHVIC